MTTELELLKQNLRTLVESSCLHFAEDLAYPIETALKESDFYKRRDKQWKQDVNKNINKLKAFEIIKSKRVNVSLLLNVKDVYDYNDHVIRSRAYLHSLSETLAKEEFDLLKEVLK